MVIIIVNVKNFLERKFSEVQLTDFENKRTLTEKGCTGYNYSDPLQS